MVEGSTVAISILRISKVFDPFVYRNGQHIDGNAPRADSDACYRRGNITLGPGVDGQRIGYCQFAVVHDRAYGFAECIHFHTDANTGYQAAAACTGSISNFDFVARINRQRVGCQLAAYDPARHPGIDIVHRNTAGNTHAEYTNCRAHGNQCGVHGGFVVCSNGKSGGRTAASGRTALRFLQRTVLHIGGNGRSLINQAHADVQRPCHALLEIESERQTGINVHVINTILMARFHLRVVRIIYGRIGHQSDGRTLHVVDDYVVAGIESKILTGR